MYAPAITPAPAHAGRLRGVDLERPAPAAATAHLDRLGDIVLTEPEQDAVAARAAPPLAGAIEVERVSFRYDPRSPLAVDDVSVAIAPGQKVAIVGRSGSGKSTLGKLLLGLYEPTEGEIRFDALPAHELARRSVRRQVGVVLQEPVLFSGSIRQNSAFNDPGASPSSASSRPRATGGDPRRDRAHADGLRDAAGRAGNRASRAGSASAWRWRARCFTGRGSCCSTSGFQPPRRGHETCLERNRVALACTRVVIAHRLSTVEDADLTLVMERGRVVERRLTPAIARTAGLRAVDVAGLHELGMSGSARRASIP